MKKTVFLVLINFMFVMSAFSQSKAFDKIILFQSNEELSERSPDIQEFSNYIKKVQEEIFAFNKKNNDMGEGYVIIALRPVGKSNVWFDVTGKKNLNSLKNKILSIAPSHVQGGSVVFAISNLDNPDEVLPVPEEWEDVIESHKNASYFGITELVDEIWPSEITKKEKDQMLKLISSFKKEKDFSEKTFKKYSDILNYAVESDLLSVNVDYDALPKEISDSKYGSIFLLAFIACNIEQQLKSGVYKNAKEEGIAFQLSKYEQLKTIDKNIVFKSFEDRLKK